MVILFSALLKYGRLLSGTPELSNIYLGQGRYLLIIFVNKILLVDFVSMNKNEYFKSMLFRFGISNGFSRYEYGTLKSERTGFIETITFDIYDAS